ncbi:alpha/beta fold hydrolase [Saccharothrix sp. 6-C]|uniref:type I polyketide synthase n=1 Tax=Saccharothrix sp. 6-C TaxID=2781735 RepID=UPI001917617D|nr:type I polyketide synthase [Saccharothrix sp. 6-C]QQQ73411.1 alpha/beta fold hydrolase [Saccharothrix sp. 6-C]
MTAQIDDQQSVLRQALTEIRELRTALADQRATEPIAVVGMACRFPGGNDLDQFWGLLREGGDAVTRIPEGRWNVADYHSPGVESPGKSDTDQGAFLDDVEHFDAGFFGVSPREAAEMDPQQRLLLEVGWEALEHAGQAPDRLVGSRTGVFVGVSAFDYVMAMMQRLPPAEMDTYWLTSNASTFAAGRLAYLLGLEGPAMSVDTACSSSLVAVHLAVQSLNAGDCDMALAGGVNVMLSPEWFVVLSKAKMLSPDGRCKTFDKSANGYVRGEGAGVVVLKRLSDAIAARDRVLGVIRGTAVNQDGRSSGLTVPNGRAQQDLIRHALDVAGLDPARIGYVEAHGTGTSLGDPIEIAALGEVLGRDRAEPFAVGSVKTNIGHLEPAAGIAGLIKTLLVLRHGEIPPLVHLTELNPEIPATGALTFPTSPLPWPRGELPRVAAINSFGASGTNAHLVLEEAPDTPAEDVADRPQHVVTLSAKSEEALTALATDYLGVTGSLPDIAFTANVGRARFPHRLAVRADSLDSLRAKLSAHLAGTRDDDVATGVARKGKAPKVAFLFTGQGAQYAGMGRELHRSQPTFRAAFAEVAEVADRHLDRPLRSVLFPDDGVDRLSDTAYAQPALFALEYALARLWLSWGVRPAAMLGHSLGEYVALTVAGVLTPADAMGLVVRRAALMATLPTGGAMASVLASRDRVLAAIGADPVAVAAVNGPESAVVSGPADAVAAVLARLAADAVPATPLAVSHAFHSALMDPVLDEFEATAATVRFGRPRVPVVSNLTGEPVREVDGRYLRDHLRSTVLFGDGVRALTDAGCAVLLEIGPSATLLNMAKPVAPDSVRLPSLRKGHDEWTTLLRGVAALHVRGVDVDWSAFDADYPRRKTDLPTYPFQRVRHWFKAEARPVAAVGEPPAAPAAAAPATAAPAVKPGGSDTVLGQRIPSPLPAAQYRAELTVDAHPCLAECVMDGLLVVNAGFYLDAALRAARELSGADAVRVTDLAIVRALLVPEDRVTTQLVAEPLDDDTHSFTVYSQAGEDWPLHATGAFTPHDAPPATLGERELAAIRARCGTDVSGTAFYRSLWVRKHYFGPSARWIERIARRDGEALAWLRAPDGDEARPYLLHPGLVDSCLQAVMPAVPGDVSVILVGVDEFTFHGYAGGPLLAHVVLHDGRSDTLRADVAVHDEAGRRVVAFTGVRLRKVAREDLVRIAAAPARREVRRPAAPVRTTASRDPESVRALVLDRLADVIGGRAGAIDPHEPLQDLGVDSLMAVELQAALSRSLGAALPAAAFLDSPTAGELQTRVLAALAGGTRRVGPVVARTRHEPEERVGPGGMHVVELGEGPRVVFVHGGAYGGVEAWQTQLELADRWRLVVPSRLNYGLSPTTDREDFAVDGELIAELLGDGAHVVAQSYGTLGALVAAARRPGAVRSLTLVESAASGIATGSPEVDEYHQRLAKLVDVGAGDAESDFRELFALVEPTASHPDPLPDHLLAFARRIRTGVRWPWDDTDLPLDAVRAAGVPTLVVTGGRRPVFERIGDVLADRLAARRLVVDGGHNTQNTGTPFNEALVAFLTTRS